MTGESVGTDRPQYTLGDLLSDLVGSERAYESNLSTANRIEAKDGHNLASTWWKTQASLLRFQPDPSVHPGIDQIEAFCDEWGTGLTSENVRKLRGKLCRKRGIGTTQANLLSLDAVTFLLHDSGQDSTMNNDATREYLVKIANLKGLLVDRSRNGSPSETEYSKLRGELIEIPLIRDALPTFVLKCRTIQEFWTFIKSKFSTWKERADFLQQEFDPVLTALELGKSPLGQNAPVTGTIPSSPPRPDILLVTVNEHETRTVIDQIEAATGIQATTVSIDGRAYRNLGAINGTTIYHGISEMGAGGVGAMHQTVDKAIRALDPGAVIAIGVAFGVNEKKQSIGDILLSKQLRPYDLQRVGAEIILRGDKPHAIPRLINHFEGFAQSAWQGVQVRSGVILTGEKLIDNLDYRNALLAIESEAIGGEMEGTGLYVPCHEHKVDWIVLKAICDWADGKKSRNKTARQKKAAKHAVQFLIESLKHSPLRRYDRLNGVATPSSHTLSPAGVFSNFGSWKTGDFQLDQQLRELERYDPSQDQDSAKLIRLIRPLFNRAAFFPNEEGDWLSFAYVLSATRMLIQQCLIVIENDVLRKKLRLVIKEIAALERILQTVLGDKVQLSAHAERFIHDKDQYVKELAVLVDWGEVYGDAKRVKAINKGNRDRVQRIQRLEVILSDAGLL